MRRLQSIILHCSATEEGKDFRLEDVKRWHVEGNKWSDVGYHWVIELSGKIRVGRDIDVCGAHTRGQNAISIGVCYIGGLRDGKPCDTMTSEQELAWIELVQSIRTLWGYMPVHGHNEYAAKACPSFDVQEKYSFLNK